MEYTIIALIGLAIVLLLVSFTRKDQNKEVEKQIENFSITLMQEIYQLKKKIRVLEEEILIGQDEHYFSNKNENLLTDERDNILTLYEDGYSLEEIQEMTGLTIERINDLLNN